MPTTLAQLNTAPLPEAAQLLDGLYEHTPWIVQQALLQRPFASLAALKLACARALEQGGREAQIALVRAHPELAGKAMVAKTLTAESSNEQSKAGLTQCTPEEFARIQQLNTAYNTRFGWPFILAVRGPRGSGLGKQQIIAAFERRLHSHPDAELAECLRNIHRIAEIRLNDKFGFEPTLGHLVWDWQEALAAHSEPGYAERGELTVTYLTEAHRACAAAIARTMREVGCDSVTIDAVGNVVGRFEASVPGAPALLTGSHYDTVRNGGKYDGRLGIYVPLACVRELKAQNRRLPYALEIVGFAEEEGQRYKATFLASSALTGDFDPAWLDQVDADGVSMRAAMQAAGLPATLEAIRALKRDPSKYLGFVEVHIEQGPVLTQQHLPLGVVTSINGSVRLLGEVRGTASHAGTTPMAMRADAAAAVAELILHVEQAARRLTGCVGTVGMLEVPSGSINVIPGRCRFSLDLRAPDNALRDALLADVRTGLEQICARRGVLHTLEETMRASAAPSAPEWQARWEQAVSALGLPVFRLPSGAGHDAMKLHDILPQAMLFVRGENLGISHNPLESSTSDDMELAVRAFQHLLRQVASQHRD
ncbi:2-oxo-4-hydroxy-4-carboxy-5-ureidoimidazoline decarboxylase [Curvibacter sp. PAE-UM]|uniref:2-oxo-4-hydroxy-4-carboxy-5-ureidoimidazoline decarboxylase n=1 Tax=Curvibacter sp. PAE-UM TaxID=1714344 RepID=UPI00070EF445|nr:2-oxo-4-hydroxy-4-carboxy-5-ureidoimidazoline decarboxylase [Curvibacter sp. PAE-UM]KRI00001.1 allantoate amidohydrolase [Curvibacter sp. PAE-UM]